MSRRHQAQSIQFLMSGVDSCMLRRFRNAEPVTLQMTVMLRWVTAERSMNDNYLTMGNAFCRIL